QAGSALLRQFRHLCSPHLSRCPKFFFQLLSAVSCATRGASLFCRLSAALLIACFPEFLVRNRELHLGAAIPQINGCSGPFARRCAYTLSEQPTDCRPSMRYS